MSGDAAVQTFAALLAIQSPTIGLTATVTDPVIGSVAQGGIPYTRWVYLASGWRLRGQQNLLVDYSADVGTTGTAVQNLKQRTAVAGLFLRLRGFAAKIHFAKSGDTDSVVYRMRIGVTTTASDTSFLGVTMPAINRNVTVEHRRYLISDTTFRGDFSNPTFGYAGGASNVAPYPNDAVVAGLADNPMIISCTMAMSGSTDAPTVASLIVEGL